MSENNRKRSRKAKLVPRDYDSNWSLPSEKVELLEEHEPSSNVQALLPKIKTKIDNEVSYETDSRAGRFSVEIEVESFEMEVSCEDDDYESQTPPQKLPRQELNSKHDPFESIHGNDVPYNANGVNIYDVYIKPVIIFKEDFDKEMKKCMSTPSSYADKQIEIEIRRSLHVFFRTLQMGPQEQSLQAVLDTWRYWAVQGKSKRHTVLLYKCLICNVGMWHLQPFREHLRKHDDLKLCIDINGSHEASIMASFGGSIESVCMLQVEGVCWRCQKTYEEHLKMKKDGFYRCIGCWERFPTCFTLFCHEGNCYRYQKIIFASEITNESYWKCTICDVKCLSESRFNTHLADFHDVRSDLFMEPFPMKKCPFCTREYFVNNVHMCLNKPFHINCKYCSRKFQNKFFKYLHETFSKKNVACTLCSEVFPSQCAEVTHLMQHSEKYAYMYRCIFCASYVLFHNEIVAKRHQAGHVGKSQKRTSKYELMIVPKSVLLWEWPENITISSMSLFAFDTKKLKEIKALETPPVSELPSKSKEMPEMTVHSNTARKRKKDDVEPEAIVNLDSDSDSNFTEVDTATKNRLQSKAEMEANASIMSVDSLDRESKKAKLNLNEELDIKDEVFEYNDAGDLECEIEDDEILIQSILKQNTVLKQNLNEMQEDTDKEIEDEENEIQQFFFNSLGGKKNQLASVTDAKETAVLKTEEKSSVEMNEVIDLDEIDDDYYLNMPVKQNEVLVKIEKDVSPKVSSAEQTDEVVKQTNITSELNEIVDNENRICGDNEQACEVSLATSSENIVDSYNEPVNNNKQNEIVVKIEKDVEIKIDTGPNVLSVVQTDEVVKQTNNTNELNEIDMRVAKVDNENRVCGDNEQACEASLATSSENEVHNNTGLVTNKKRNHVVIKIEEDVEIDTNPKFLSVLQTDEVVVKQESQEMSNKVKTSELNGVLDSENNGYRSNEQSCEVSPTIYSENQVDSDKVPENNDNQSSVQILNDDTQLTISNDVNSLENDIEITLPGSDVRVDKNSELEVPAKNRGNEISHKENEAVLNTPVVVKCETVDESDFFASNNIEIKEEGIDYEEYYQGQIENVDIKQEFPEDIHETNNVFKTTEEFVHHTKDREDIMQVLCKMSEIKTEAVSPKKELKKQETPPKIKKKKLKYNKIKHNDKKTKRGLKCFKCYHCGLKFSEYTQYLMHKLECMDKKDSSSSQSDDNVKPNVVQPFLKQKNTVYPCSKCNKTFMNMKFYLSHLPMHSVKANTCPVCHKVYPTFTQLSYDINRHMWQTFLKIQVLEENEQVFTSKMHGIHQCKRCRENVEYGSLFEHWERHLLLTPKKKDAVQGSDGEADETGDKDTDGDEESNEGNVINKILKQLLAKDKRGLVKICVACSRRFYRNNDCKRHLIEHLLSDAHAKFSIYGEIRCQLCGDGFEKADLYKRHMRQHGNLPLFKCEMCDRTFSDSSNFAKHKKVHNVQISQCDICKKKFASKVGLEKHIELHNTMLPIKCELCFQVFFSQSSYNKHYKLKHDKNRVFKCRFCREPFENLRTLWEHLWEVHKSRKKCADCPICDQPFRKMSDVHRHAKTDHNIVLYKSRRPYLKKDKPHTTVTDDGAALTSSPSCTSFEELKSTSDGASIKEEIVIYEDDDDDDRLVINI